MNTKHVPLLDKNPMPGRWATKRIRRRLLFSIIGMLAATVPAEAILAACYQADLTGRWQVFSTVSESGYSSYWARCWLVLNAYGQFSTTSSRCYYSDGSSVAASGRFTMYTPSLCRVSGYVVTGGVTNTISYGTMAQDKKTVHSVGTFPGGNIVSTAVKF